MSKRVKVLASLFLVCVIVIAGTVSASAALDGDELKKLTDLVFVSFSEFVEQQGTRGVFLYVPYIVVAAPALWLLGLVSGLVFIL